MADVVSGGGGSADTFFPPEATAARLVSLEEGVEARTLSLLLRE